jgi:hypothetical protein
MGIGEFTDEQLLKQTREDAFHGIMMVASLEREHPLRKDLESHFSAIMEAIDGYVQ